MATENGVQREASDFVDHLEMQKVVGEFVPEGFPGEWMRMEMEMGWRGRHH